MEALPGHAKNLSGGLGATTVSGICAEGSAGRLKRTCGLPPLGGRNLLRGKGLQALDVDVVLLLTICSLKKCALRLMMG